MTSTALGTWGSFKQHFWIRLAVPTWLRLGNSARSCSSWSRHTAFGDTSGELSAFWAVVSMSNWLVPWKFQRILEFLVVVISICVALQPRVWSAKERRSGLYLSRYRRITGSSKEANDQHQSMIAIGPRENIHLGNKYEQLLSSSDPHPDRLLWPILI